MKLTTGKLIALLSLIVLLCAAAMGLMWWLRPDAGRVRVTVDGQVYGEYDLHRDQTVTIRPEDGSWYNILVIHAGTADVVEADCGNQVCVNTPALSAETVGVIACLPHGVVVELCE